MPRTSAAAIDLIKRYTGLKLAASLADDGSVTVGYGHVGRGLRLGSLISEADADRLLAVDLAWIEEAVFDRVSVDLSENEFSALVSLAFDVGVKRFSQSACLKLVNKGERQRAAEAMLWFERAPGATASREATEAFARRRREESALYLDGTVDG